jgi:predicted ArsR family transcriptional regulator
MYASREHTVEAIAKTLGVSRTTVYRHLAPVCVLTEPRDLRSVNLAFGDQRKPR